MFINIVRCDLNNGILKKWKFYLFTGAFFSILAIFAYFAFFAASPAGELRTVFSRRRQFVYGRLQPDAVRRVRRRAPAAEFAACGKAGCAAPCPAAAVVPVLRGGARLCAVGRDAARRSCGGFPGAGLSAGKGVQAKIKKKGLRSA